MCNFPETLANPALTLALSPRRGNRKCLKVLLPREKGWDEGKLVAHRLFNTSDSFCGGAGNPVLQPG